MNQCPVCHQDFQNVWGHARKHRDVAHRSFVEEMVEEVIQDFHSRETAVQVAQRFPFNPEVVKRIWRDHYTVEERTHRRLSLLARERPSCKRYGKPVKEMRGKFCSVRCSNMVNGQRSDFRKRRSQSLKGRPKTEVHRQRISETLKREAEQGTLAPPSEPL